MLVGIAPVAGIASVAAPFIAHWVGVQYVSAAVPVMWVTLASLLLWAPGMYAYRVALSLSRVRLAMAALVGAGLLNVLLSVAFVRYLKLGLLGVAGGTLVSVILWSNIFMGLLTCRSCSISPARYFVDAYTRPYLSLAVLLSLGWAAAHLWRPSSLPETLILLGFLEVSFCPILFAVGLTGDERTTLLKWLGLAAARPSQGLPYFGRNRSHL